jgi:uncharacterized membrane protein
VDKIAFLNARTVDWPLVHIMLNHFPIILTVAGTAALLLATFRGQRASWLYGTISLTLAAVTVIPTYFTGAPAEHALNRPWYVARGAIHTHEDAARIASILVVIGGLVAVVAWRRLVRYPREVRMPGALRTALLVTALAASVSIGYTSWLGGRIVHDAPVLQGPAPAGYVRPDSTPRLAPAPPTPATAATPAATSPVTPPADSAAPPAATMNPVPARPQR